MSRKWKKCFLPLCCPRQRLYPFLAGISYAGQLLQLIHSVESDPIKSRKYFSCYSIIYPFLLSLLPSCLTSGDFIFLKTIILLFLLCLFPVLCLWVLSQSHHPSTAALSAPQWNSATSYAHSSDLDFLLSLFHTKESIDRLLRPFQCPRKPETTWLKQELSEPKIICLTMSPWDSTPFRIL